MHPAAMSLMEDARSLILTSLQVGKGLVAELAVVPLLKVLSMGAMGAVLAHPRFDVINTASTKVLSKLVFALFLPCLIFTELGAQVTFENMIHWWFIPVNVILAAVIGCSAGYVVALVCQPPRRFYRFTVVMTGIGNTGNLPLAIVGSICHNKNTPFGSTCKRTGVAYISFATWIAVIIVYSFVYHMLEAPEFIDVALQLSDDDGEINAEPAVTDVPDDAAENVDSGGEVHSVFGADWPGLEDAHNKEKHQVPFLKSIWRRASMSSVLSVTSEDDEFQRVSCLTEPRMMRNMRVVAERTPIQHIFQPPMVASLLAISIGMFPISKGFIFSDDAPLAFVNDSLIILAEAMVPCIMLVLGGTLSGGPGKSELGLRTTIGICVTRLVVLPIVGIGVVELADFLGFLPNEDPMYRFVLFLQYTMPTAILCGAMASLRGYGEKEAASLLFWQHLVAFVSISVSIAIYINLLAYI